MLSLVTSLFSNKIIKIVIEILLGFFKKVWEVGKLPIPLPIGVIFIAIIVIFYYKDAIVKKAIQEYVAQDVIKAKELALQLKEVELNNVNAIIERQNERLKASSEALQQFQNELNKANLANSSLEDEVDELLRKPIKDDCNVITRDFIDGLRNNK